MMGNSAPEIDRSTAGERSEYIAARFHCIADCDQCGICAVFGGKDPQVAYKDYIEGRRSFMEVSADYKRR